jgi:membrane protease YdiL (CAAX protease family)
MIENRRFINQEDGVMISIFITTLVYFMPSIVWGALDARSWIYFVYSFFTILFIAYAAVPLYYSRINFSFQINVFRINNYSVLVFLACFLYFGAIELFFKHAGIEAGQYSIFKYIDSLILHIQEKAGLKTGNKFIGEAGLMLAILLPICEELFFRCYMQESLKRYYNIYFAVFVPALLVAVRHLALFTILCRPLGYSALFLTFAAFVSFAFFGYVYEREENVLSSMIVHFAGNVSFGVCSIFFGGGINL